MSERYLSKIVVDLLLERKSDENGKTEILMMKRTNTGYFDGYYDLLGGHLEAGEDLFAGMIREAKEEIGIVIKREDMEMVHIYHKYQKGMLKFVFKVSKYEGNPINAEPEACEKIEWIDFDNLPENTIPGIRFELESIRNGIYYASEEAK